MVKGFNEAWRNFDRKASQLIGICQSNILPSVEIVTTCQGMNLPLF